MVLRSSFTRPNRRMTRTARKSLTCSRTPPPKKNTIVIALPLLGPHIPTSPPRNPIRGNKISGIRIIKDFIRPSTTTLRGSAAVASRRRLPLPATQLTTQRNPLRVPPPSSANPLRAQPRARAPSGAAESQRASVGFLHRGRPLSRSASVGKGRVGGDGQCGSE